MSLSHSSLRVTPGPIPPAAGVGLRFPHHQVFVDTRPPVGWLEVHAENYMGGGTPLRYLETLRRDYPVSFHGIGLSLGSADGLDPAHLERLCRASERIEPGLISEHLSWSAVGHTYLAELLPLPMTEEALDVVCRHVEQTQDRLGRRILVENPSTYLQFSHSTIPEWEFLSGVSARTGCGIGNKADWVSGCDNFRCARAGQFCELICLAARYRERPDSAPRRLGLRRNVSRRSAVHERVAGCRQRPMVG